MYSMNKISVIHVTDKKSSPSIDETIFQTMSKSFEMSLKHLDISNVDQMLEEEKIHVVMFDNIDYHDISLDLTNFLKDKFAHIHIVLITTREDEQKQMRIYNKRIDHIWESTYSSDYFRTIFRALLTRMSRKYVIAREIKYRDITVNHVIREVKIGKHFVDFTDREYKIFYELILNEGGYIEKEWLFKKIWKFDEDTTRLLDQYLHRIKKKIEPLDYTIEYDKGMGIAVREL